MSDKRRDFVAFLSARDAKELSRKLPCRLSVFMYKIEMFIKQACSLQQTSVSLTADELCVLSGFDLYLLVHSLRCDGYKVDFSSKETISSWDQCSDYTIKIDWSDPMIEKDRRKEK